MENQELNFKYPVQATDIGISGSDNSEMMEHQSYEPISGWLPENTGAATGYGTSSSGYSNTSTEPPMLYPHYANPDERKYSYNNSWPVTTIPVDIMVHSGFFHTGYKDHVKCFQCGVEIGNWEAHDDPYIEHRRFSQRCTYIKKINNRRRRENEQNTEYTNNKKDIIPPPKFPRYATYKSRMDSFTLSVIPDNLKNNVVNLVESGFFFTGNEDVVRCFQCGIGLRKWGVTDTPWVEHARFSEHCDFCIKEKGLEYIKMIKIAYQNQINSGGNDNSTGNGSGTGNSTSNSTNNSTNNSTGNSTGNSTNNSTNNTTGNSTNNSTNNSTGNSTNNSTGSSSAGDSDDDDDYDDSGEDYDDSGDEERIGRGFSKLVDGELYISTLDGNYGKQSIKNSVSYYNKYEKYFKDMGYINKKEIIDAIIRITDNKIPFDVGITIDNIDEKRKIKELENKEYDGDVEALNKKLRKLIYCGVCNDNKLEVFVEKCYHRFCQKCANSCGKTCITCKQPIIKITKFYYG